MRSKEDRRDVRSEKLPDARALLAHAADVVLTGPAEVLLPELILPI